MGMRGQGPGHGRVMAPPSAVSGWVSVGLAVAVGHQPPPLGSGKQATVFIRPSFHLMEAKPGEF